MAEGVSLLGQSEVLSEKIMGRGSAIYLVKAKPISDYFDGFWVSVSENHVILPNREEAAGSPYLFLDYVAAHGANQAVIVEEVRQIASGLVSIITSIYNPDGSLQVPEPKYEIDNSGNHYAFFTAHFTTCPVKDAEKMKVTSSALRKRVFDKILFEDGIPGFSKFD